MGEKPQKDSSIVYCEGVGMWGVCYKRPKRRVRGRGRGQGRGEVAEGGQSCRAPPVARVVELGGPHRRAMKGR